MGCFLVPLSVLGIHTLLQKSRQLPLTPEQYRLRLLLLGGVTFGVVDHTWNNELFLIGPHLWSDLGLGVAITATIFLVWGVVISLERRQSVARTTRMEN
jgi:hypothetical protein